jgi:hypothetical protein
MGKGYYKCSTSFGKSRWLLVAAVFAFCVAPTFISYQPYLFAWDDADYLARALALSRAFWAGNIHGVIAAMVSGHPPAMTLLGLPWGPSASWDSAGKCFITLAAVISFLTALCLYLLLRIGLKPLFLAAASMCVLASLGPNLPEANVRFANAHWYATAFLADSLFAWTALAAVLLIPYEARTHCPSIRGAVMRGILWGSILSLGVMTKLNFLYFILFIVPTLFLIRLHHGGLRSALAALTAFACWSAPSAIYLARYGGPAFALAKTSSFGRTAEFYHLPLLQFLGDTIRESPGLLLSFVLTVTALIYLVVQRRRIFWGTDFLAFLIMIGFGIVVLASNNREIRFAFPAIVALPFLTGILMSGKEHAVSGRSAALAAGLVFCGLLAASVPTAHRATRQILSRADAILAQAAQCNAKRMMLATDSPTLNLFLIHLAIEVSASGASVNVGTLAYEAMRGMPIEEDFHTISEQDLVVFQDRDALSPPFTNKRVSDYERYIRKGGHLPIRVGGDLTIYSIRCIPSPSEAPRPALLRWSK